MDRRANLSVERLAIMMTTSDLSADTKIVTEQILAGDVFNRVREMIFWAEQIVFLGFG